MVSDGMGVDSTAMLIALKRLHVRPDVVMHADTGDEHPETVVYRDAWRSWLERLGAVPELRTAPPSRRRHLAVVHDAQHSLAA